MSTNNTANFEIGAYIGIALSEVKAKLNSVNDVLKAVGADNDPSWKKLMLAKDEDRLLDVLCSPLTLKHIHVAAVPRNESIFVEIQISIEAMQAYTEYSTEVSKVATVIFGLLKSIVQVLQISGLDKAAMKMVKVFSEHK